MNSIRDNLTRETMISEIKMICCADVNQDLIHLVVEGPDDSKFFKGKVTKKAVIYESFSGKTGVIEIINHFNSPFVIGICDRDYDQQSYKNIYYYDFTCLELMMVHNSVSYEAIYREFYAGNLTSEELLVKIFENLKWISCFRKLSYLNKWGVKFQGLSLSKAFNNKTYSINLSEIIIQLNKVNNNFCEKCRNEMIDIANYAKTLLDREDYFHLIQGHDFISVFHCYCRQKKNDLGIKAISAALRCSYSFDSFKSTSLYNQLREYEDTIAIPLLLT